MAAPDPLDRLREIRDVQVAAKALTPERDRLIRELAGERSQRELAEDAGLRQTRINQVLNSD